MHLQLSDVLCQFVNSCLPISLFSEIPTVILRTTGWQLQETTISERLFYDLIYPQWNTLKTLLQLLRHCLAIVRQVECIGLASRQHDTHCPRSILSELRIPLVQPISLSLSHEMADSFLILPIQLISLLLREVQHYNIILLHFDNTLKWRENNQTMITLRTRLLGRHRNCCNCCQTR